MSETGKNTPNIPAPATLSFLISSHVKVTDQILEALIGRDELTICEAPNREDVIGSLVIDVQKSNIRGQKCLYVHQVFYFQKI